MKRTKKLSQNTFKALYDLFFGGGGNFTDSNFKQTFGNRVKTTPKKVLVFLVQVPKRLNSNGSSY